jgi:hypothetical protein
MPRIAPVSRRFRGKPSRDIASGQRPLRLLDQVENGRAQATICID